MLHLRRFVLSCVALSAFLLAPHLPADDTDTLKVGIQPDGRVVVPTNQILKPAGKQVTFPGRPVDLAWIDAGKTLVIKNRIDLVFLDAETGKIKQTLPTPKPAKGSPPGFGVVGLVMHGERIYASDAHDHIRVAERQLDGTYKWAAPLTVEQPKDGKGAHPAGLALNGEGQLWATSTRGNNIQLFDLATGKMTKKVSVGVAPYAICVAKPGKAYVSNWGGDPPKKGDPKGDTSGTPVQIDPRIDVANHGSVSVVMEEKDEWKQVKTIEVGLHPSGLALSPKGRFLYVANANSDTVSVIDTNTDKVIDTIACRPVARLPFGSGCNAVALSPDSATLYVANGTNNCVVVIRLGSVNSEAEPVGIPVLQSVLGLIPTGWYPGAVLPAPDGKSLIVANVKGHGSLGPPPRDRVEKGHNSHDHLGSVSLIPMPDEKTLAAYTREVNANNRLAYSLAGLEKPRADAKPVPVPQRHGEPSVFKHVVYIIKENRTYDQLFGDMKEGNGDPKLVMFGEEVTPNHHALAREFTLFDNFYCSGVLSADGHSWCDQAYVTDYLEKAFGGFTRSYPDDGIDPLAFAPTGFLWDNALLHKKTFRNFGEHVRQTFDPKNATWTDLYNDYKNETQKVKVNAAPTHKSLVPYTHTGFAWFPLVMPDVYRARLFIADLKEWEKKGEMPNLITLTLPCDHTVETRPGSPTPRAMVADNDLALGQVVEALSKSKFWPETCIFVVEDDPQSGFDHVDGHRTVALVVSPYTKRKHVDSTCYNQTGMVKTIELLLGLPPMNQLDLSATAMRNCFSDKPDLAPYQSVPNRIKLDEMNGKVSELEGPALHWAKKSIEMDLDDADEADEDTLNRILWFSVHGEKPYPAQYVGQDDERE